MRYFVYKEGLPEPIVIVDVGVVVFAFGIFLNMLALDVLLVFFQER